MLTEAQQVADGCATPAVDCLTWVADSGDRVRVLAVQRREQHTLRDAGVLVFVQEHRCEPQPLARTNLGCALRDPCGQRDLVAEVEQVQLRLALAVGLDHLQQLVAGAGCLGDVVQRVGRLRERGDFGDELRIDRPDVLGVGTVLGHFRIERQQVLRHGPRLPAQVLERSAGAMHD